MKNYVAKGPNGGQLMKWQHYVSIGFQPILDWDILLEFILNSANAHTALRRAIPTKRLQAM